LRQSQFWTPIPRLRGSKLGSDSLLMKFERRLALVSKKESTRCSEP
jgi:hypothetical protein